MSFRDIIGCINVANQTWYHIYYCINYVNHELINRVHRGLQADMGVDCNYIGIVLLLPDLGPNTIVIEIIDYGYNYIVTVIVIVIENSWTGVIVILIVFVIAVFFVIVIVIVIDPKNCNYTSNTLDYNNFIKDIQNDGLIIYNTLKTPIS